MPNLELSEFQLPSGSVYSFRDDVARAQQSGAIINRGVSITALTDFATTNPISIATLTTEEPADWSTDYTNYYTCDSTSHTFTAVPAGSGAPEWAENTYYAAVSRNCVANDAVFYITKEFVFDGTAWHQFGDMSGLAAVATTGDYDDLNNKPTIPSVDATYDAASTNAQSGTAVASAIANQGSDSVTPVTSNTVVTDMSAESPSSTQASGELLYCSVTTVNGVNRLVLSKLVKTTGDSVTAGSEKTFVTPTTT